MIRTFFRHEFEALKSLQRNGWMTIASASAVTITLVLVGIFLGVIMNVSKLATDIENDVNVNVFVSTGTTKEEMKKLQGELGKIANVDHVKFSSSDEQYQELVKAMGEDWQLIQGDTNPLYDVFILSTTANTEAGADKLAVIQQVAKAAEHFKGQGVEKVDYGGLRTERLTSITRNIQVWGLGGAVLLLFVAVFLISNTIRITILSRQREIQIMRLVGAKNGFIRWPFFFEGGWIGIIGAILPVLGVVFGYPQIFDILNPAMVQSGYSMVAVNSFVPQISILLAAIGVIIGSLGSIISMGRFLKA
ncbi:MAG: permease-like cell division protein FtsX [Streptococcaceae bacterium]|nr:permease-like cell division protein FtsX [Streptococcaceae bacterium]